MRARRFPFGVILIIPVVIGMAVYAFTGQEPVEPAPGQPEPATATASATATLSAAEAYATADASAAAQQPVDGIEPAPPTPTPEIMEHGPFRDGMIVRVRTDDGTCLNARWTPSLQAGAGSVNVCAPEGYEGLLIGPAVEQEGHWWWYLAGAGYVVEDFLVPVRQADLGAATAPQYAQAGGRIAFQRNDGSLWSMRPDGSEQRQLVAPVTIDGYNVWPENYAWSPDGLYLSYNLTTWFDGIPRSQLHIVSSAGVEVGRFDDVAGRSWSPAGTRIAVVSTAGGGASGSWQPVAGWVDVTTGEVVLLPPVVTSANSWVNDLPSFNFDGTLLLLRFGWYGDETDHGQGVLVMDLDGRERFRQMDGPAEWWSAASWSPVANVIAMRHTLEGRDEYVVRDLDSGAVLMTAPVPPFSTSRGGGCGGGAEMERVTWSRDGRTIHFGWMFGDAGANGVWTADVATGATRLLPLATSASSSSGPGTLVAASTYDHIFIGDTAGGMPTLITDGRSPVWSSGQ